MERQQVTKTNQGDQQREILRFAKPTLPSRASIHPFLHFQQTIGNQAMGRFIQAKLKINQPGDVYEQEADRVADEVMRMLEPTAHDFSSSSSPSIQRKCAACASGGGTCPECAEKEKTMQRKPWAAQITPLIQRQAMEEPEEEEKEEETIQAKEVAGGTPAASPHVESYINSMRGGGQPLPESARAFFEPRFGYDFSSVRVHSDSRAAESSQSLDARAFTLGQNIVFGARQYAPYTDEGNKLLAHELVHVIQQHAAHPFNNKTDSSMAVGPASSPSLSLKERESVIQRELVYASGYPRRFRSDAEEVRCVEAPPNRCIWAPSSVDFRATAENSGGGTGQSTFRSLLDHIGSRATNSISELGLIGHANSEYFGLSGRITNFDVFFTEPGLIGMESIRDNMARIEAVRDRFAADAKIVLYGCHAGVGDALLNALSQAFRVCVQGFSNEILTCIEWQTPSRRITSRGRVMVDTAGLVAAELLHCPQFHTNVRSLTPDRESCAGVPRAPASRASETAPAPDFRWSISALGGADVSELQGLAGLSGRLSLRTGSVVVFNPIIGLNILYSPSTEVQPQEFMLAIADMGLRIQQPLRGAYLDVTGGGFLGFEAETGRPREFTGGLGLGAGAGWRWERVELGAEARTLFPLTADDPTRIMILGRLGIRFGQTR